MGWSGDVQWPLKYQFPHMKWRWNLDQWELLTKVTIDYITILLHGLLMCNLRMKNLSQKKAIDQVDDVIIDPHQRS